MIYLDNSATTYPKPQTVINSITEGFVKYGANPGRSGHSFSIKSAMKVFEVREKLATFFNASSTENVIFTSGCTEAINLSLIGSLKEKGHIIATANDHNSTLRTLEHLKQQKKIEYDIAFPKQTNKLSLADILPLVKENTYLICVNHISNVDGMESDIAEIGKFCFENSILFLVDVAQSAGHKKIDMLKTHIDFLTIAGHKGLYGPMGIGALIVSDKVKLVPLKFGGTGTDSINLTQPTNFPEGYESGTIALPAIIGLGAGLDFVNTNFNKIVSKLDDLTTYLNYSLRQIEGVTVYTHEDNAFGIIAFNVKDIPSTEISQILDEKYHILTRSGLHCAPLKHKSLGTTVQGAVRVSMSAFTKFSHIEALIKAIKKIANSH